MEDYTSQRIAALEGQVALLAQLLQQGRSAPAPLTGAGFQSSPLEMGDAFSDVLQSMELLQPLFDDHSVNDILINGAGAVYVERNGVLEQTSLMFSGEEELFKLANAIAAQVGRHLNPSRPLLDTRLPDGSRVNIIAPPLSVDGMSISIRKFSQRSITLDLMAEQGNISFGLAEFLKICSACRLNMLIAGGTGSGKTTLLNAISQHINPLERVVTIEDAAELRLQQPHVVRLETKPSVGDIEEVSIRDLVKNALRMRPDRIIVGEVRGPEAFDMMQAMNTGHEGSLTSIHANHPRDAIARLNNMMMMANLNLPTQAILTQISSALHLVVQVSRMRDGVRRITHVSEVVGMESDIITMQDLFVFQHKGEGPDGKLVGDFKWTGIMPRFLRRVSYYGEGDRMNQALGVKLPKMMV